MAKLLTTSLLIALALATPFSARADRDGFNDAVKVIEQFYHVKHQNIPLLARAGVKAVRTAAKIRGGKYKKLAEAGSVRVAFFEDQAFNSHGQIASFKSAMQPRSPPNGPRWSRRWRRRTKSRLMFMCAMPAKIFTCW